MGRISCILMIGLAAAAHCAGKDGARACGAPTCLLDKPGDYDSHLPLMSKAIENNKRLLEAQKVEELDDNYIKVTGDAENCYAVTTVKRPFALQSNDSLIHKIVQSERFQQKIKWTECFTNKPGKACFESVISTRDAKVRAQCVEQHAVVLLYAFDPKERAMRYLPFHVPVGCVCKTYEKPEKFDAI